MKKLIYILVMVFIASGANAQIDRSKQPKPGPAPKVNITQPKSFELSNGLKVIVVENHKLPRVSMSLTLDNPPFIEGNKKGIHSMTGGLLGNGTDKTSKEDFQEEIDFMGASLNFHSSGAFGSSLSRYFPKVLNMMAEGIISPKFTQEDFDKEIAREIDGLKSEEKSVTSNAQRVENILVYGANHPFGEFVTEEKLKSLTLNDIKDHYGKHFVPNNAYLVIVGDVKFDQVEKLVKQHFSGWKKGNIPASNYKEPVNVGKTEINFVDMPNAVQSEVRILSSTHLKMTDKDYFPVMVANQILGGDFNSYLNMNLREAHGWTYGARSSISANKYVGKFRASASVRNEVTDSTVIEAMKELDRIRTQRVTEDALATTKAGMIGNFVMDAEKPQTIANMAVRTQTQGLPSNFYQNYIQGISGVTAKQVQDAAKKYFSYDNARILVVGKAADVLPGLEKLGYKINYFDRFGNPTTKPEQREVSSDVTVQSVFDNYIAAVGGDKAKAVKTVVASYEATVQGMKLDAKIINTSSGKSMSEMKGMGMVIQKSAFNGETGYNEIQGQRMDMSDDEIKEMKYSSLPFPEMVLAEKEDIKIGGIENFNGKDAYVVLDGDSHKSYYDMETGLKLGTATEVEAQGQKMVQSIYFNDYQEYDGIKFPQEMIMDVGMEMVFKLIDVKFNTEIADSEFE